MDRPPRTRAVLPQGSSRVKLDLIVLLSIHSRRPGGLKINDKKSKVMHRHDSVQNMLFHIAADMFVLGSFKTFPTPSSSMGLPFHRFFLAKDY